MLPPAESLRQALKNLPPTKSKPEGIAAFVSEIANFCNMIQGGPTGSPGIFTFGNAAMTSLMMSMPPVSDDSWKTNLASAFEAGLLTGTITPGTVVNPAWAGSGTLDVLTLPAAAATIITIPVMKTVFLAGLASVGPTNDAPLPLANAVRDAMMAATFLCIGLGPPPTFIPTPLPISGQ